MAEPELTDRQKHKIGTILKAQTLAEKATEPAEAEAAAARVADMMARYEITEAMLAREAGNNAPEKIDSWKWPVPGAGRHSRARCNALSTLGRAVDVESVFWTPREYDGAGRKLSPSSNIDRTIEFIGHETDLAILRRLVPWLTVQWENSARRAALKVTKAMRAKNKEYFLVMDEHLYAPYQLTRRYNEIFRSHMRGFADGVAYRLKERRAVIVAEVREETGQELVLVGRHALVKAHRDEQHPDLKNATEDSAFDLEAWREGVRTGHAETLGDNELGTAEDAKNKTEDEDRKEITAE